MGWKAGIGTERFHDYHSYCLLTIPGPTQSTDHVELGMKARNFNIKLSYSWQGTSTRSLAISSAYIISSKSSCLAELSKVNYCWYSFLKIPKSKQTKKNPKPKPNQPLYFFKVTQNNPCLQTLCLIGHPCLFSSQQNLSRWEVSLRHSISVIHFNIIPPITKCIFVLYPATSQALDAITSSICSTRQRIHK